MHLSRFLPRFTVRRLMGAVALVAFLLWAESMRKEWAHRYLCYRIWCEQETELMDALDRPFVITYCGMAPPDFSPKKMKEMEDHQKAGLLAELEYYRERKARYARALWRPWLPLEPNPPNPPGL